jgi:two-component system response regulator NreC
MALRVLLADDHEVVRQGFRAVLEREGFAVTGEAANGRDAVRLAEAHRPDVAVIDLSMPILNGLDAGRQIVELSGGRVRVVLLTMFTDEQHIVTALRAGIRGYVIKTQGCNDLIQALREVASGGIYLSPSVCGIAVSGLLNGAHVAADPLSPREREVLQLIVEGRTSKEVATILGLCVKTAESHRSRLMEKLKIHDTATLVRYAIRQGIITP